MLQLGQLGHSFPLPFAVVQLSIDLVHGATQRQVLQRERSSTAPPPTRGPTHAHAAHAGTRSGVFNVVVQALTDQGQKWQG